MSNSDPDRDPAAQIRETIRKTDQRELPIRTVINRTDLNEQQVVTAADSMEELEFDHAVGLLRLTDGEPELRGDGGVPTDSDTELQLALSMLFDDGTVEVTASDVEADINIKSNHGELRLVATENSDERTFDVVVEGSPEDMAQLGAQIQAAAELAEQSGGESDA